MHRVTGFLEQDVLIIHVKHVGLKILTWNYDIDQFSLTPLEVPEYHGDIDLLRTTADG